MVALSILSSLLAATCAVIASDAASDGLKATRSTQERISRPNPPVAAFSSQPIECPPDFSCGGSAPAELLDSGEARAWCTNRVGARCGRQGLLPEATYAQLRAIVGCEALPVDAPLCSIGSCQTTCLCRESLLKRLENLLLGGKGGAQESDAKDEL